MSSSSSTASDPLRTVGRPGYTGPWHVPGLQRVPSWRVDDTSAGIEAGRFVGEPYRGRPTEVFAYLGVPEAAHPVPGIVCLHAGDGRAYRRWVARWNARGYAAIAIDLGGRDGGGEPLPRGGPPLRFLPLLGLGMPEADMWTYHAVASTVLAHGLLASRAGVDPRRVGVTGISWGGALACVAAGLDRRTACAVPVYGTGFLLDPSGRDRSQIFDSLPPSRRARWHRRFDPAMYLPSARCPMLYVTGAADGGFPLDILRRSARVTGGPSFLAVHRELGHSHEIGWSTHPVDAFADDVLGGDGPRVPVLGPTSIVEGRLTAAVLDGPRACQATLLWTEDDGPWKERAWQEAGATTLGDRVESPPPAGGRAAFFNVTTADGRWASTPYVELPESGAVR